MTTRQARFNRVHIDGLTHADAGRRTESNGTMSHVLICEYWRRYVEASDVLLGRDVAVTCLWCAAEAS